MKNKVFLLAFGPYELVSLKDGRMIVTTELSVFGLHSVSQAVPES